MNNTENLLRDLGKYKTVNREFHAGDVLEHSVWSALYTNHFFAENNRVVNGISRDDKRMLIVASLLHDIGKGGDGVYTFFDKENHPEVGGYYFQTGVYPGVNIDLREVIKELGEERNYEIIKFLVRWHWMIGGVFSDNKNRFKSSDIESNAWPLYYEFNLVCHGSNISYEKRVYMFRLLWVIWEVDLLATQRYPYEIDEGMPLRLKNYEATHRGNNMYEEFKIAEKFGVREFIINVYEKGYSYPDFSQEITLYRSIIKLGDKYYKYRVNNENPFIWKEEKINIQQLKPFTEMKMLEENKKNCLEFLQNNNPEDIPLFAGYPEIAKGLSKEKLAELYAIISNTNYKYIFSFFEKVNIMFREDELVILPGETKLYHGRGYRFCEPPNISLSRGLWLFQSKKYAIQYSTGRGDYVDYPGDEFCWNILEYKTVDNCRLLNLSKPRVRSELRRLIGEKVCEKWVSEINEFVDIEGNIKYSHILDYMFPSDETRQSHTTVDVNMACVLDKVLQDIDGWYIEETEKLYPEVCIFKPYKKLKLISHDYFDGKRMSGLLQRCTKRKNEKICVEELTRSFKDGNVVCLDYGEMKPIECYLLNELSAMSDLEIDKIKSEIDKGNLIITVTKSV